MVNVGLVTGSSIPNPRASPCTHVVFPAPRSPCSATVASAGSSAAHAAASERVSSAVAVLAPARSLSEMLVATVILEPERVGRQGARAHEPPDAGEWRARECPAPGLLEGGAPGALGHAEDELVVLAVAEGVADARPLAQRQHRAEDGRDGAPRGERGQVLREAVAHVHHGADVVAPGQPRPFLKPGFEEIVMAAREAPAEDAGHIDPVAGPRTRPREHAPGHLSPHGERRHEGPRKPGDVAADDWHPVPAALPGETPVEIPQPLHGDPPVEGEGDDRRARAASHGGDVAQVALEELR